MSCCLKLKRLSARTSYMAGAQPSERSSVIRGFGRSMKPWPIAHIYTIRRRIDVWHPATLASLGWERLKRRSRHHMTPARSRRWTMQSRRTSRPLNVLNGRRHSGTYATIGLARSPMKLPPEMLMLPPGVRSVSGNLGSNVVLPTAFEPTINTLETTRSISTLPKSRAWSEPLCRSAMLRIGSGTIGRPKSLRCIVIKIIQYPFWGVQKEVGQF